MQIEKCKISELKPADYNPRKSDAQQEANLKESLQKFGVVEPVVVNKRTGNIVGGHFRVRELTKLGFKEVECVIVDLSLDDEKELNIRLNANTGDWDWEALASDYDEGELAEWGLGVVEYFNGDNSVGWNPDKTEEAEIGDGINDLVGYGLQSFWKDIKNENCPVHKYLIELPKQKTQNLVRQKYSRTNLESIQRVVKTYMREGDYFLESCVGWAIFSSVAKYFGFSGVGTDIWEKSLLHCKKQLSLIQTEANIEIKYGDAMDLPFNDNTFDFLYCNPPFMDAEKYSGNENDIATKDHDKFKANFIELMSENYRVLKNGNLCVITINDKRENGFLVPVQSNVIKWGELAGFKLWDFVIAEVLSQKIRLRKKDYELRRTVKCHEYIIVFKKI